MVDHKRYKKDELKNLEYLLNKIVEPIVCVKCSDEYLGGFSDAKTLQDYSRIDVGFTNLGLQIWCQRHQVNICHINFDGKKPLVDFRCLEKKIGNELNEKKEN
tara:strand:+ start:234 stop:542 length:309 start_codon:yes stop_codon:yes gene_type:complete